VSPQVDGGFVCVMQGFAFRDGHIGFYVSDADFEQHTDDELAERMAEEILGYPVGSIEDIMRKLYYAQNKIDACNKEIERQEEIRQYWATQRQKYSGSI
jgi:hypothetical protein